MTLDLDKTRNRKHELRKQIREREAVIKEREEVRMDGAIGYN